MTHEAGNNSFAKVASLGRSDQMETIELRLCLACLSEVRPRDCYCRRCGASQNLTPATAHSTTVQFGMNPTSDTDDDMYHRVSGSLVKAITAGLSSSASARLDSRYAKHAILALISIPIWMIIVLLSPLDAYATARTVIRQQ